MPPISSLSKITLGVGMTPSDPTCFGICFRVLESEGEKRRGAEAVIFPENRSLGLGLLSKDGHDNIVQNLLERGQQKHWNCTYHNED